MIKAIIIEDESPASHYLEKLLQKVATDIKVVETLRNVDCAVKWLSDNTADLIFLDIQLGEQTAFTIFDQLEITTPVIFTTASEHHALRAFRLNSVDYLLKPLTEIELQRALDKYRFQNQKKNLHMDALTRIKKERAEYQTRFLAVSGKKIRSVPIENIAYFIASGRYICLVTKRNEKYLLDQSLESIVQRVDPNLFFRINRQMIIGFDSITQMMAWSRSRIKIELHPAADIEVVSSVDNTSDFRKWLDR